MKQEIDNFSLIRPLLNWSKEGEFYFVQLLLRLKDGTTTFNNKNNSARIIKTYQFYNVDQFNSKELEIKALCNLFKCRAGINFNKRSDESVAKELLRLSAEAVITGNYKVGGILNTIHGSPLSKDKFIIVDIDDTKNESVLNETIDFINNLQPFDVENKVYCILPTYSGWHIITSNFRKDYFNEYCNGNKLVSYHLNNPACLFYPEQNTESLLEPKLVDKKIVGFGDGLFPLW